MFILNDRMFIGSINAILLKTNFSEDKSPSGESRGNVME